MATGTALAMAGIGALMLLLYFGQRRLIYVPTRGPVPVPDALRTRGVRPVAIRTQGGVTLSGWFWPTTDPEAPALLWCHGNAGDIGLRASQLPIYHDLGLQTLIFDYRGYGESEGRPTEEGLYRDVEAARTWLRARGILRTVLLGRSLGAAVALQNALEDPPDALLLEAPFTSLADMAARQIPIPFLRYLVRDRFDNAAKIGRLRAPVLIVHGTDDSIVPFAMTERLFRAAPQALRRLLPLPGADHNDLVEAGGEVYVRGIRAFLAENGLVANR